MDRDYNGLSIMSFLYLKNKWKQTTTLKQKWSLIDFSLIFLLLWSERQPNNNISKEMAASSDDNHLFDAEWYWGNISRYWMHLYG